MDRISLGAYGERLAATHLAAAGCIIRDRNWRTKGGELDLVAEDGGEIIFVEVKTRQGNAYGYPEDAVTYAKRRRLRLAAHAYLTAYGLHGRPYRFDIVAVTVPRRGGPPSLARFRNAVGEHGGGAATG